MPYDTTGKVTLDHIYTQPDPRAYFTTLRGLDYCVPQLAEPHFADLISHLHASLGRTVRVLDMGCSYGINATLLNGGATMAELYHWYGDPDAHAMDHDALLDRDRKRFADHRKRARIVGLDSSQPALDYAYTAGILDDAVCADLETNELTELQRAQLSGTDLVISTGCIGYVGAQTVTQLATIDEDRMPWMAHFVLRMVPFEPIEKNLSALGYEVERVDSLFRQRRFVSDEEQAQVMDTLHAQGIDPHGLEDTGWLYAQLHLCRPPSSVDSTAATDNVAGQHLRQG
ncbi:class I SAM-dependent methyltransferase [Kibdelosporangium philippinense]|uniref:Class I SAM-dependent methyltransferase n=1 Tax=Kibdelosporangium philippinense TaxID=211113 RepID=A0ABS8Z5Z8_9PSEU|nr:class I SAM-dependent methyltransferase [Kibdelosporangium philippinense]MCE7003230.1 class I SAM-dependent methyltransferase [Kibdelosporangium philippinense]